MAAFHKLTSGPTVTSNFPPERREYRNASSMTRYKSRGIVSGRECEEWFKRLKCTVGLIVAHHSVEPDDFLQKPDQWHQTPGSASRHRQTISKTVPMTYFFL